MSGFTFAIPLGRDDLLVRTERDHYIVEDLTPVRHLKSKLQDCLILVQQQGAAFITTGGFDVIFSLLQEYHQAPSSDVKELAFNVTTRGMGSLVDELSQLLNANTQMVDAEDRIVSLNTMKMTLYAFCQLIDLIEADQLQSDPITGGKQKGKKKSKDDDFTWDWERERLRAVTLLYNLVQLKISQLFDPPTIEEEVINLIASTCFKILENPSLAHQKTKDTRNGIIQVLGTMNKKFGYTLSCGLKFIQHLKHFDHLVQVLGQATEMLVREYGCTSLVTSLIREISRIDPRELARDTGGTRSYSLFLVDVAERMPEQVKPNIAQLTSHLDGDSYTMRKCVLGILAEIVAKQLSGEELDESGRDDRDSFLDCLEDHMHDINSFVRSHVLHCWSRLCKDKCIPLARQHRVLELCAGRLQDKSSTVRRAAVQLLKTLLESNPFAAKLETEELEKKLREEDSKLAQLCPEEAKDPVESWADMEGMVEEGLEKGDAEEVPVWEGATVNEVAERVAGFLDKKAVSKAVALTEAAKAAFPKDDLFGGADEMEEDDEEDEEEEPKKGNGMLKRLRLVYLQARCVPEPSQSQSQGQSQEEITKQKMLVGYLKDSVKFSKIIHKALPVVAMLLGSKQSTDILEAIDFFVSAFEFGVQNSMLGVRRMLSLIWSGEATIREAVVAAYKRLYIESERERGSERAASAATARNLIALVSGATLGELTSMEKLVSELVASKDLSKGVVTILWEYFTFALSDSDSEKCRDSILLLGMCGLSEVSIISANIQVIVDHGLSDRAAADFRLARNSCEALLRLVPEKLKQDDPNPPTKYPKDNPVLQKIWTLITEGMWTENDPHWMPMAKEALTLVFKLGDQPDSLAGEMIKAVCVRIQEEQAALGPEVGDELRVKTFILKRLCFLAGHVALCMLIYLDVDVFTELKRRQWMRDLKKEKDAKKKEKEKKQSKRASMVVRQSAMATPKNPGEVEDDDMGCVGAEADDMEAEFIRKICDKELLSPSHLLGCLAPLIISICANPTKYSDCDLRASASLALAKLMLVSSDFCEKNLQLLFTVLEKAEEPVIRANLIVALGDLSCRFPNTIEPWTPKMYARLHDEVTSVRSNTLTVLAHLILNDMIKVKGQISDIAFCIVDPVDKIAGLSKLFFAELAKKGNTLYNVMPDIVSRLSDSEVGIEEEPFRTVMRHIIGLIEKDKLQESLVEKLCHRFRSTKTERQWRDISYCLSLFSYSDRSLKKLADNFSCWSDKLHSDAVYSSVQVILAGAKKSGGVGVGKEAARLMVEELEARVEEARAKGVEDSTADRRAADSKAGQGVKTAVRRKKEKSSSDEDEEEEVAPQTRRGKGATKTPAKTPSRKKKVESSDEEDEKDEGRSEEAQVDMEDDDDFVQPAAPVVRGRRGGRRK